MKNGERATVIMIIIVMLVMRMTIKVIIMMIILDVNDHKMTINITNNEQ